MRVVSLLASGTEIVCGLGAGESLVGRSHECDHPSWVTGLPMCTRPAFDITMSSGQIDAEVRRRLRAGEPLYHVDTERIDSLKPDLLITQEHCEVCAVTPADVRRAGCAVARQVVALQAGSVQGIYDGIRTIGRAMDRDRNAEDLVGAMKNRIGAVHNAVKHRRPPSLVALEWTDPIFAMGNWGPELVEAANGRLLLGENGEHSRAIDWHRVREADPEWLIIAPCGFDLKRTMRELPGLEALPGWFDLRAVRQGRVVLADGNTYFNRSGTTIVETVEILAEILHGYPAGHQGKAWVSYSPNREASLVQRLHAQACASNRPTYTDPITGYDVFTADYLRQRGYCCGNGCRHCPYPVAAQPTTVPGTSCDRT
jgi:iron complex transport system substrate-binding protein